MSTRAIAPCDIEMVRDYLAKSLRIEVQITSDYNGSMHDGPLYTDSRTIELILEDQVISYIKL